VELTWFAHRKTGSKFFIGFAALLALNAAIGLIIMRQFSAAHEKEPDFALKQIPTLQILADLRSSLNNHRRAQFELLAARVGPQREVAGKYLREAAESIQSAQEKYSILISDPEEHRVSDELNSDIGKYLTSSREATELLRLPNRRNRNRRRRRPKSDRLVADLLFGPEGSALHKALSDLQGAVALNLRIAESTKQTSAQFYASAQQRSEIALACSTGTGALIALAIACLVIWPLRRVMAQARKIAAGDFSEDFVTASRRDEAGEFARYLHEIQTRIQEMVASVKSCAQRTMAVSERVSLPARKQAEGADIQHEQVQQVAAAAQEMTSMAQEISAQSRRAAETARETAQTAGQHGAAVDSILTQMQSLTGTMSDISKRIQSLGKSSEQVGEILLVIDDIASQTNLLALNASIESARAGAQGRGFAVVAGEVSKLAERTTKATKEIGITVGKIQTETQNAVVAMNEGSSMAENGVQSTQQAAEFLRKIITDSRVLEGMVSQIAKIGAGQAGSRERVASGLEQISMIARESNEGAAQITSTAEELAGIAAELQDLENRFQQKREVQTAEDMEFVVMQERKQNAGARRIDRNTRRAASKLALAPPVELRPAVAKIHARLLTPVVDLEPQPHAPSTASGGTRA
jgi:methyl-accepting chemotaxis protein